jgi:hypothetical protein
MFKIMRGTGSNIFIMELLSGKKENGNLYIDA